MGKRHMEIKVIYAFDENYKDLGKHLAILDPVMCGECRYFNIGICSNHYIGRSEKDYCSSGEKKVERYEQTEMAL